MNTIHITSRNNTTGAINHTKIVYLDPPRTVRRIAWDLVAAVVVGMFVALVYMTAVILGISL